MWLGMDAGAHMAIDHACISTVHIHIVLLFRLRVPAQQRLHRVLLQGLRSGRRWVLSGTACKAQAQGIVLYVHLRLSARLKQRFPLMLMPLHPVPRQPAGSSAFGDKLAAEVQAAQAKGKEELVSVVKGSMALKGAGSLGAHAGCCRGPASGP